MSGVTEASAAHVAERIAATDPVVPVPIDVAVTSILESTARLFGLGVDDVVGPGRSKTKVEARMVAMAVVRARTGLSLPEIGRAFGGRNHKTVHNAVARVLTIPVLLRWAAAVAADLDRSQPPTDPQGETWNDAD